MKSKVLKCITFCLLYVSIFISNSFAGNESLCKKDELAVGSWNIQNLGRSKINSSLLLEDRSDVKVIDIISKVANLYDVIGILEVSTGGLGAQAVANIVSALNKRSNVYGENKRSGEKYLANSFDHVIYNKKLLILKITSFGKIDIVQDFFFPDQSGLDRAKKVSDHLPIYFCLSK